jgi:NitT/TauT family transport system permease protein
MLDVSRAQLEEEIAGLDALELAGDSRGASRRRQLWTATWPKLAAIALAFAVWQVVVWSGWQPEYVLPGPGAAFAELGHQLTSGRLLPAVGLTLGRVVRGYAVALVLGAVVGLAVARSRVLRSAFGSLITGLQTMPSVVWFPFALIIFKKSEAAIMFVVVLGAAPSIANGLISGIDLVPPLYVRAGRVLGANRLAMYRHVILPAAMPNVIGGLKQGWGFAWRSLMAGELLVIIPSHQSIGVLMQNARDLNDMPALMASMIVILVIGIFVDAVFFAGIERSIRRRRGLLVR